MNLLKNRKIKIKGRCYFSENKVVDDVGVEVTYHINNNTSPNLIFIHGLAGSSNIWCNLMDKVYNEYNIYALDLPWNGKTEIEYKGANYVTKWFSKVLNSFNLSPEKTTLISHSFGATISLIALIHGLIHPANLILCSPTWKNEDGKYIDWNEYKQFIIDFENSLYKLIKLNRKTVNEEILKLTVDKILEESSPRNTLSFIDCLFNIPDIPKVIEKSTSILILTGLQDEVVDPKHSHYLHKALHSELITYSECDHYLMLENADNFNKDILKFLK